MKFLLNEWGFLLWSTICLKTLPSTRVLCGIISEEFYSVFTTVGATASDSITMG